MGYLQNGWTGYGGDWGSPYFTIAGGRCYVEGLIHAAHGWHNTIAILPASCRPKKRVMFDLNNHGNSARVDVDTNGVVSWHAGGRDHSWLSLSGMRFDLLWPQQGDQVVPG